MEFAPSGVRMGFEATWEDGLLGKAAMTVFDISDDDDGVIVAGPTAMNQTSSTTYVGYFTASGGRSYLIRKAIYTDGTFTTEDSNFAASSETIQAGGVDISVVPPAIAQTNKNFIDLPNMEEALLNWLQPMIFGVVLKQVINFNLKETAVLFNFRGVWQPFSPKQLKVMPIGQRAWSWFWLHTQINLGLQPDDTVTYGGKQFRVMSQNDFSSYRYFEYTLIEDFTGSGPTT